MSSEPTVFHLTHWKAGSQWVRAVLAAACPQRIVPPKDRVAQIRETPIRPGAVYTCVYLNRERFEAAVDPGLPQRRFLVMRDLRDALVSWYFSMKVSHAPNFSAVVETRSRLQAMDEEEGLLTVMHERLGAAADIVASWFRAGTPVVRYEDLIADEQEGFRRIFEHAGLDTPEAERRAIVEANSFERQAGRPRGQERIASHFRKGVAGDWANHFTPRLKDEFKQRWGDLLIELGYERDLNW